MGDEEGTGDGERQPESGLLRVVWIRQMLHRGQSSVIDTAAGTPLSTSASDAERNCAQTNQQGNNNNSNADTAAGADDDDDDDSRKNKPPLPANRVPRVIVVEERRGPPEPDDDNPALPSWSPMTPDPPPDVPRGCCAVYVGTERRRFVVPTAYLGDPVFARLLEKAEEEFGFDYGAGAGITIPCDTEAFKYILVVMDAHSRGLLDDEGNPKEPAREEGEASEITR